MPGIFNDPDSYPGKVLDQPYAGAVRLAAEGQPGKTIETRTTRILHVPCTIVIVAGVTMQYDACLSVRRHLVDSGRVPVAAFDRACSYRGVALVLARVVDCRQLTAEDFDRSVQVLSAFLQHPGGSHAGAQAGSFGVLMTFVPQPATESEGQPLNLIPSMRFPIDQVADSTKVEENPALIPAPRLA